MSTSISVPHIVIVGGGAGGLELATKLGHKLGKRQKAKITLVDATLTHLWKPLLHEVAAGTLNSNQDELNYIAHAHQHYYQFQFGKMRGLNRKDRLIELDAVMDESGNEIIPKRSLSYDILVLSIGSLSNDFATPGVIEHCLFLDTRQQADRFQHHLINAVLQAQTQQDHEDGVLNIAIVGGGATGVELAAELQYAIQQAIHYGLTQIDPNRDLKITLIESSPTILSSLPPRIVKAVHEELTQLGIKIYNNERVTEVTKEGLKTNNSLFIHAAIKVWAAGIKAADFLKNLDGLETNRVNQIVVKNTLQTTRDENIFAFGDCACCPLNHSGVVPPRAQAAHQQASLLTRSLIRHLAGRSLLKYHYRDYGSLISLSEHTTIGNLMGRLTGNVMIEGAIARFVYLMLYKMHQVALHGWWRVTLMTLSNLLTGRVKPRLKLH